MKKVFVLLFLLSSLSQTLQAKRSFSCIKIVSSPVFAVASAASGYYMSTSFSYLGMGVYKWACSTLNHVSAFSPECTLSAETHDNLANFVFGYTLCAAVAGPLVLFFL